MICALWNIYIIHTYPYIYPFANCSIDLWIQLSSPTTRKESDKHLTFLFLCHCGFKTHITMCLSPPSVFLLKRERATCCKEPLTISSAWDSEERFRAPNSLNRYFHLDQSTVLEEQNNKILAVEMPASINIPCQSLTSQMHFFCF